MVRAAAVLLAGIVVVVVVFGVRRDQRTVLWHVVQLCVADEAQNGKPRPCSQVNLSGGERRGYVVLEDPLSRAQFLVMPTQRITGIESPEIVSAGAPNYLQAAWRSRSFVFERLHRQLPRDAVALAVNSSPDRSQDQLHIHVDCLQPNVRSAIDANAGKIGPAWKHLEIDLAGHRYWARRVDASDLRGINPFRLLSDWVAENGGAMWRETLVVVGMKFSPHRDGFVLLADTADPPLNPGHGESLLDHSCALAQAGL